MYIPTDQFTQEADVALVSNPTNVIYTAWDSPAIHDHSASYRTGHNIPAIVQLQQVYLMIGVSLIAGLDSPLEHGTGMWDWII